MFWVNEPPTRKIHRHFALGALFTSRPFLVLLGLPPKAEHKGTGSVENTLVTFSRLSLALISGLSLLFLSLFVLE